MLKKIDFQKIDEQLIKSIIIIKNISINSTREIIHKEFSKFGNIELIHLDLPKKITFIKYESESEALKAIEKMNLNKFMATHIFVHLADPIHSKTREFLKLLKDREKPSHVVSGVTSKPKEKNQKNVNKENNSKHDVYNLEELSESNLNQRNIYYVSRDSSESSEDLILENSLTNSNSEVVEIPDNYLESMKINLKPKIVEYADLDSSKFSLSESQLESHYNELNFSFGKY